MAEIVTIFMTFWPATVIAVIGLLFLSWDIVQNTEVTIGVVAIWLIVLGLCLFPPFNVVIAFITLIGAWTEFIWPYISSFSMKILEADIWNKKLFGPLKKDQPN